jgi:DNA repair exonuclease SbcCD ATPase subunit
MEAIMGGVATANERQAALRARRRAEGLEYIHVWALPDQERAIKAYLANPDKCPLHVTDDSLDVALDAELDNLNLDLKARSVELHERLAALAERESQLQKQEAAMALRDAELDAMFATTVSNYQQYQAWLHEAEERLESIRLRESELNRLERELKTAGARLKKDASQNVVTDKARTEALIHRFTTERDYSKAGMPEREIVDGYRIEQRSKEITKLTSRTKSVRTSLETLTREFKDLLGEKESSDLEDAMRILDRISNAAATAQKKTRALEARIKDKEKQQEIAAYQAATSRLQGLSDAEKVMLLCILDPREYKLETFLGGKEHWQSKAALLVEVEHQAKSSVVYTIKSALKSGQSIEQANTKLDDLINQRMPQARDTFGRQIQEAIAAVVAERLAKANS